MEIIRHRKKLPIRAAVFDWDGTVSTLREGWESIMAPMMLECINPDRQDDPALIEEIQTYINESTGIQTIYQMQWLAQRVEAEGKQKPLTPWEYKEIYNVRLLKMVKDRVEALENRKKNPADFMIQGSAAFLERLTDRGVDIYVASGTDHDDVVRETKCLGLYQFFKGVEGAPMEVGKIECSKERVICNLLTNSRVSCENLIVVGDGKVEIRLGTEFGAYTIGVASDEKKLYGMNPKKKERLLKAGADMIIGDYIHIEELTEKLGLEE